MAFTYKQLKRNKMRTKQFLSLFLILTGMAIGSHALAQQTLVAQVKPQGCETWGYANLKGELIIPAQYSKCYGFTTEGYAIVVNPLTNMIGFINLKGEEMHADITDYKILNIFGFETEGFSDGLLAVKVGKKWGYLDTSGKVAIATKYDNATSFNGGYAVVKNGETHIILNKKGEEIKVVEPGVKKLKPFTEGLAPFKSSNELTGFIGVDGKVAIAAKFKSVGYFTNGIAWAEITGDLAGYINTKGEWIIKPQFTAAKDFDAKSGLARVKTNDTWAYVNKEGEILNMNNTKSWGDFSEGLAEGKRMKKYGFYNNKGEWVIEPIFDNVRAFKNGYASVKVGEKWGVINTEGKFVIEPTFSSIKDFEATK